MAPSTPAPSKPHERQIIQTNATLTAVGSAIVFYVLYNFIPVPVPTLPTVLDKLIYTLRLNGFSGFVVVAAILMTSMKRLHCIAVDPLNGNGEHLVALEVRFLTNTLEQFVVSFVGQLILTTYLSQERMKAIPILVMFFVFGRVAFYVGYKASYLKRTVGYMSTYGVTLVVWCFALYFVVTDLFV